MFSKRTLTDLDKRVLKEKFPTTYEEQIKKVENGYPIQYLLGDVPFFNVQIKVNENVLIPRFETEYLVEKVLNRVEKKQKLKCLDVCTGSGCIAIAIAKNTNFICTGIDISNSALDVAKENAQLNQVHVDFKPLDILKDEINEEYDIILANPPYIAFDDAVDPSTSYEPQIALFAEENGMIFYRKILESIKNKPKLIAFEIGENEGAALKALASKKFPNAKISIEKDLVGKDRYLFIEQS